MPIHIRWNYMEGQDAVCKHTKPIAHQLSTWQTSTKMVCNSPFRLSRELVANHLGQWLTAGLFPVNNSKRKQVDEWTLGLPSLTSLSKVPKHDQTAIHRGRWQQILIPERNTGKLFNPIWRLFFSFMLFILKGKRETIQKFHLAEQDPLELWWQPHQHWSAWA